ncbi:hypothetical protein [Microbacterium amylolyticum]|uniref:Uncharacterized protein n=1 Tax=Microbacterium amylolyticum TaxID=936337 RepID=A0ABS4ZE31_9MICO|nr:hypothetical protein [Microbacterium amylolyticum]MBP2435519.1 hypothetical protein [Microbacterium amylolyticum]
MTTEQILALVPGGVLSIALATVLVLVIVNFRRRNGVALAVSGALIAAGLVFLLVLHPGVPPILGMVIAVLGSVVAIVGGDPATRRLLAFTAADGVLREGPHGGILLRPAAGKTSADEVLRGGMLIGYLERTAAVFTIIAGFGEGLALLIALKGIGRFSELAAPEARERFIIGTLASLLWACVVAVIVRLSIT